MLWRLLLQAVVGPCLRAWAEVSSKRLSSSGRNLAWLRGMSTPKAAQSIQGMRGLAPSGEIQPTGPASEVYAGQFGGSMPGWFSPRQASAK